MSKKKVLFIVTTRSKSFSDIASAVRKVDAEFNAHYSDCELLNNSIGFEKLLCITGDPDIDRINIYTRYIAEADKVVFMEGWDESEESILIKRICDVCGKSTAFENSADTHKPFSSELSRESTTNSCRTNNLINMLCCYDPTNNVELLPFPNLYDDWMATDISGRVIRVGSSRAIDILRDCENPCVHDDKKLSIKDFSQVEEPVMKHITINPNNDVSTELIHGIFFSIGLSDKAMDKAKECDYDLYYVSGFDNLDIDCPLKLSKNINDAVRSECKLSLIGIALFDKGALDKFEYYTGDVIYIDGTRVFWDVVED